MSVNEENDKSLNKISYSNKIENIIKIRSFKYLNQISLIDYDEKEINLDIINLKIINDLCYMSISNFGLITYNIQQESFNIIFRHEKITTFILSQNNYNYIGIFLNNNYIENNYINNRDSREFYVEIRKNENKENYYEINKIFYSDKSSKNEFFNNYVHDSISDHLFFISNENNIIYYIKINLPYLYDNFDGKFSIQNKVNNKILKGFNFT